MPTHEDLIESASDYDVTGVISAECITGRWIVKHGRLIDALAVDPWLPDVDEDVDCPASLPDAELARQLSELSQTWKRATAGMSLVSRMIEHPAYQQIIALGYPAVPFLLRELQRAPDHWFVALRRITGENPVPQGARGNVARMVEAWIEWGKENGLIS
jgi:hypothetical protein